ncbi:hypothetical protein [Roseibium sp.]|uniref:hypothetical protein n=1 Tax=Roseibium sp. TaxID=1936156 RepID=UPI003B523A5C
MTDIPRLLEILADAHSRSIYADVCGIDRTRAKTLLMEVIRASFDGEAYAAVAEVQGQVEGFILGVEEPLYLIGDKSLVTDLFWVATSRVNPRDPRQLMAGMVEWGQTRPHAVEIRCGTTPVIQEPEKAARMLKRLGFKPYGQFSRLEIKR